MNTNGKAKWRLLLWGVPVAVALVAAWAAWQWLSRPPAVTADLRLPGADQPPGQEAPHPTRFPPGELKAGSGGPANLTGDWPGFRGPNHDGGSLYSSGLADHWPEGGPRRLWTIAVGEGHAGAAVLGGRVYLMDYDRDAHRDAIRCLSLADGREIWRYAYSVRIKRNHGMSRTVPAVTTNAVVTLGPKCHVACLDPVTGRFRWGLDLVREFGATVPPWYAGQCPLIDGNRVILAPGGPDALLVAVDAATGTVCWKTPNPMGWTMSHSSILPLDLRGRREYVYCASGGVLGVDAADGRLLWSTDAWKISIATVPTPVRLADDRLFLTGGYNAGSLVLELPEAGGAIQPRVAYRLTPDVFAADQTTPVLYNGYLYGIRSRGELTCLSPDGRVVWTSGAERRFGLGPLVIGDGKIYALADNGTLVMARATPDGCQVLGQARILEGPDAWGPLALAGSRLIARDLTHMVCLELGREQ